MFAAVLAATPDRAALASVVRDFSPRVEICDDRSALVDVGGLERLVGEPPAIAAELRRTAADRGLQVRVAVAGTRTAARLLVHARPGLTVVDPGDERWALAALPIDLLAAVAVEPDLPTLRRWGVRTLGALADLPGDALAARLGQPGVEWQRLARGEDPRPLVPAVPEERFEQALDLEWPIEDLEPLSFVLGRLLEPLSAHLERRDRGAAVLHVRLHLIKTDGPTRGVHERSLQLPVPLRDARTLRTLALLDLESNPPPAAVDRVVVAVDPTPGPVVQYSLLTRPLPSPEQLSTLLARLTALMGEGRCGAPQTIDSWRPGAGALRTFPTPNSQLPTPKEELPTPNSQLPKLTTQVRERGWELGVGRWEFLLGSWELDVGSSGLKTAVRRFRLPVPVRVRLEEGKPVRLTTDRRGLAGGDVTTCAGPWRTSGAWWDAEPWHRDEWDVTLAGGDTYRLFHDRDTSTWFLDGVVD